MAQVGWVYLDNAGGRHRVGLYHGDQSGHLVIHCNMRVIQIDFSVRDTKRYSFFIEDELCEIDIVKENNDRFTYDFHVNKTVDTPRNRIRRADERVIRRHLTIFVGGLILVLTLAFLGIRWYGQKQREKSIASGSMVTDFSEKTMQRLAREGKTTDAILYLMEESLQRKVFYGFKTADSTAVSGKFQAPPEGIVLLPNGFPLRDGDSFHAVYLPATPQVHRLDFFQPTRKTVEAYLDRAIEAEQKNHPEATPARCACLAQLTLDQKGWFGLADILLQQQSPEENPRHNRDTYQRLIRDVAFEKAFRERCWDK